MLKIQFIIRLNSTVQYFFRARDIWLQTAFASKSYVRHGRSLCHVCTKFRFDEDWDVLLPESPLPLLRVGVLVVWYDPCSDDLATFDDRNALISITRAITCGNLIKFAFQNGWQPVARHFNLPNHFWQHMGVYILSPHQGSTKSRKTPNKNIFFTTALSILAVSTNAFHSTNLFCCFSRYQAPTSSVVSFSCI